MRSELARRLRLRYFLLLMKRIVTFAAFLCAFAPTIFAQNAAPGVSSQLPTLTLYAGAPNRPVDLTLAFQDPDLTPAVRLQTVVGPIDVALYQRQKPITVANFLRYVDEGRYFVTDPTTQQLASSFIHRSVPNFVIQGGGYIGTVHPTAAPAIQPTAVQELPPIQNEPGISNKRSTVGMAKSPTDPNSATSQWFINLSDNSASLDTQNGGFTVFATVIGNGMNIADRIGAFSPENFGSPFESIPLRNWVSPDRVEVPNLISLPAIARVNPVPSPLTFTAVSDNAAVVDVKVSDGNLLIAGKAAGTAHVTVTAKDADGAMVSQSFAANVANPPGRLVNISTRARVGTGDDVMIGGFIMRGDAPKRVIIRALGPTLAASNISGILFDPKLELYNGAGELIASDDNWADFQRQAIVDTQLAPTFRSESAIVTTLPSSSAGTPYTAIVRGARDTMGVALVEVYDLDAGPGSTLLNISTRAKVGTTDEALLIGGFFVRGLDAKRILIRALGPSLPSVLETLADPTLELRDSNGAVVEANNDWQTGAHASDIQASGIAPMNAKESAVLQTLAAGSYTAIVRTNNNTAGIGSVEIYQLP